MRIGIEDTQLFPSGSVPAQEVLAWARKNAFDGVGFKLVTTLDPGLDPVALQEVAAEAGDLYMEVGIGSINPCNLPETPWVRRLGDGDTVAGLARMIRAAAGIGCHELLATTAHWQGEFAGRWSFDRFRTDVTWEDQLELTARLIARLAPVLRECGSRLCIETHEEISSFEVLRLVETAGEDVATVAFDVGNVICRGEDPLAAAARVARHTRLTHVKDAILVRGPDDTYTRWLRPCGSGFVDWPALLALLDEQAPGELTLTLEDNQNPKLLEPRDPAWRAGHPDVSDAELETLLAQAQTEAVDDASRARWTRADRLARLSASRDALRSLAP